ncbi:unnamed protein product [Gadus morhua 'NCC']
MAAALLWLLAAGTLLVSAGANEAYDLLHETYKKGVDLTLEQLNSHVGINHHFLFFKSLSKSDIQPGFDVAYIYHNFVLKATKCSKGTVDTSNCPFRNDRPLIDCAVCYKTYNGVVEATPKPYIHCIHRPALTEVMKTARINHCNEMGYSSGAPTLLASIGA